ncbi:MAG TPA: GNAT family N-acetyltransferase [Treponemataceae bacterium]|nr:GNAT family N-acetyltransferase [Treponemataceae bacterium]
MKPALKTLEPADSAAALSFLAPREFRCIALVSSFMRNGTFAVPDPSAGEAVALISETGAIDGIVFISSIGFVFHCLGENIEKTRYAPLLKAWLSRKKIHSILGCDPDTEWLGKLMPNRPWRTLEYRLMLMPNEGPNPAALEKPSRLPQIHLRKAAKRDAERILPLQIGYEEEEVIPPGETVRPDACLLGLKKALEKQRVFIAEANGEIAAKAGTNARGFQWEQLGGVYTMPGLRGNGLACYLTANAAKDIMNDGKRAALFVKVLNEAAKKAYIKAGFVPSVPFRISYF